MSSKERNQKNNYEYVSQVCLYIWDNLFFTLKSVLWIHSNVDPDPGLVEQKMDPDPGLVLHELDPDPWLVKNGSGS